jgi:hypothetical protein
MYLVTCVCLVSCVFCLSEVVIIIEVIIIGRCSNYKGLWVELYFVYWKSLHDTRSTRLGIQFAHDILSQDQEGS